MLSFGLCCLFREAPIKFRTTTARATDRLTRGEQRIKLAGLCRANAEALGAAITYCGQHGIGCFRINSQVLPLKTHPDLGYSLEDLPDGRNIRGQFEQAALLGQKLGIRLTMHPDQFVVINSPRDDVVENSIAELEYHAEFATWTGVDIINIHGGGAYGDKDAARKRFIANTRRLSSDARQRLTLENDDRTYTPADLLPVCDSTGLPLVYDVHHHRCLPDALSIPEATQAAIKTWSGRTPLFHISSPKDGWESANPRLHHDFLNPADIPDCWKNLNLTVEIEAKAKELALKKLLDADLQRKTMTKE